MNDTVVMDSINYSTEAIGYNMLPWTQRRTKMKWGLQAKLIDEALLKYYFVNISLLPRYICIQHIKSSQNT